MTIRGYCRDCLFRRQEWAVLLKPDTGAMYVELDHLCDVSELFVPDDGFCHHFEPSKRP